MAIDSAEYLNWIGMRRIGYRKTECVGKNDSPADNKEKKIRRNNPY
jgi:hypothetical protein